MKKETVLWLSYAHENLEVAQLLLQSSFFNPCLQNIQQAIEKALKAALIEKELGVKKTHNIQELVNILKKQGIKLDVSENECELIDSIYLSSKYPTGSVLPDFSPNKSICDKCIHLGFRIYDNITMVLN
jgi:HEPN domain-containing protein